MKKTLCSICISLSFFMAGCSSLEHDNFAYLVVNAKSSNPDSLQPHWIAFADFGHRRFEYLPADGSLPKIWGGRYYFSHIDFHPNLTTSKFTMNSAATSPRDFVLMPGNIYFVGELLLSPSYDDNEYSDYDMEQSRDESMMQNICSALPDMSRKYPLHLVDILENGRWEVLSFEQEAYLECEPGQHTNPS